MPAKLLHRFKTLIIRYRVFLSLAFVFGIGIAYSFMFFAKSQPTTATSTSGFKAGNIISDAVMSNYKSMTVSEIQQFLTSKNPCSNQNYKLYTQQSAAYPSIKWHWTGDEYSGHFVCLSEERFGDGTTIGSGQTAAEIIYNAAQQYRINPQVLIVLLEKEQGLITDTFPHSGQYRAATGYGCPDTAACDSRYYGFKNQVYRAAELFRYTLDNGSTLYPDHRNVYIAYNPSSSCGGTSVYIENRATSALYRYTPYQPNSAALSAGYGLGNSCSAYGNRNFYLYFTEWFGSTQDVSFENMAVSRILEVQYGAEAIKTNTLDKTAVSSGYRLFSYKTTVSGELCLADDSLKQANQCIRYSQLRDYPTISTSSMANTRQFKVQKGAKKINYSTSAISYAPSSTYLYFTRRVYISGQLCLQAANDASGCYFYYEGLSELQTTNTAKMDQARRLIPKDNASYIELSNNTTPATTSRKDFLIFTDKTYVNGELCLSTGNISANSGRCVLYSDLQEVSVGARKMDNPRNFYIPSGTKLYDAALGTYTVTNSDQTLRLYGRLDYQGSLCLQTEQDYSQNTGRCYKYGDIKEANNFIRMDNARTLKIKSGATYVRFDGVNTGERVNDAQLYFTKKIYINGVLYLATDQSSAKNLCIPYSQLMEL